MDSGMISRIKKSKRYAEEREQRIDFSSFTATIKGENRTHTVRFGKDTWSCTCDYFKKHGNCSHTRTFERVLNGMIPGPSETGSMPPVVNV